jgi:hypothetical protein
MANIASFHQKTFLDWSLGGTGAAVTQPASRLAALASGIPTSISASELSPLSAYTRQTALFTAANSPAGSASNTAGMTWGPFSSVGTVQGLVIFDTSAFTQGNMLWYGSLLTARTVFVGDQLVVAPGALIVTLS